MLQSLALIDSFVIKAGTKELNSLALIERLKLIKAVTEN